jgi:hypothetical protein
MEKMENETKETKHENRLCHVVRLTEMDSAPKTQRQNLSECISFERTPLSLQYQGTNVLEMGNRWRSCPSTLAHGDLVLIFNFNSSEPLVLGI